jgi:uncharacterized SAM-binding protein YcdF (DUF218 family)
MIYGLLKQILLPPVCFILLGAAGMLTTKRRGDAGWWGAVVALCLLYALSTPFVADTLLSSLEIYPPLDARAIAASRAQAIVVLSAETTTAPEYGGLSVGPLTLVRLRYAAYLHARTQLPVLVTGGRLPWDSIAVAERMKAVLVKEDGVSDVWVEGASTTTRENAVFSAAILRAKGIRRVLLVTHAWHMPRARMVFEQAGMEVVPAPTAFTGRGDPDAADLLPSAKAVMKSYYAFYEGSGWLYYKLQSAWEDERGRLPSPDDRGLAVSAQ